MTEEIGKTILELLLQNERRWGTPISILKTSFECDNKVIKGKERAIRMWC